VRVPSLLKLVPTNAPIRADSSECRRFPSGKRYVTGMVAVELSV